jgi:hypothetical protein
VSLLSRQYPDAEREQRRDDAQRPACATWRFAGVYLKRWSKHNYSASVAEMNAAIDSSPLKHFSIRAASLAAGSNCAAHGHPARTHEAAL